MLAKGGKFGLRYIITIGLIVLLLLWLAARTFGQSDIELQKQVTNFSVQTPEESPQSEPVFSDYKGIKIGTHEDELLTLLDIKPRFVDKDGYFFILAKGESAQFVLDANRNVKIISLTYSGKDSPAPTYEQVFGADVPVKQTAPGKVFNLVNYPDAGFWVSFFSSMGENPTTTITMQKLLDTH